MWSPTQNSAFAFLKNYYLFQANVSSLDVVLFCSRTLEYSFVKMANLNPYLVEFIIATVMQLLIFDQTSKKYESKYYVLTVTTLT